MKNKKYLLALAVLLAGSLVACSPKKEETSQNKVEEKKDEKKDNMPEVAKETEKASAEEKEEAVKLLEEQKKLELDIPTNKDSDKKAIEEKYQKLIASVKEDKLTKSEVAALTASTKGYIENVKKSLENEKK